MKTIYKYQLEVADQQVIEMPAGAQLLDVGVQPSIERGAQLPEVVVCWALIDTDASKAKRRFYMRGTGHRAVGLEFRDYIGTVKHLNSLVWHIFDGGQV